MKFSDIPPLSIGQTVQLIGMVYAGPNCNYLLPLTGESVTDVVTQPLDEMTPEDWKACLRQSDIVQVEVVHSDGVTKAMLRKCERQIDATISWRCFRRDGFACRYCGREDVPLTVDHLVLWEEGGPTIEPNLLSSCKKCNRKRGNMQYADWLNSETYRQVSRNLKPEVRKANLALVDTLSRIQRVDYVKSR